MAIGAIENDVPDIDPRDEAIAEIAKDRQDERDEEFRSEGLDVPILDGEVEEDPEEVSDEETANDEQEEGEEESAEEEAGSEEKQEENNKKHTLKVDGEEIEVDEQDIINAGIRTLQKESSADKRLEEATRLLNEAKEQVTNSQPSKADAEKPSLSKDDAREIAHSIQYGDEDESAEAVQKMVGRSQATQATNEPPVDVDAAVNDRLAFNDAIKMMEKSPEDGGFSDILESPELRQILENTEADLRSKKEWNSYSELFSAAGKSVREFRDNLTGKSPENVTDIKSRQQRKKDVASSISGASGTNQTEQKPEKPKTRSEVIEEMRKSR